MRFRAEVLITLKSGVLDTQGKAVSTSLRRLGHQGLDEVRIGRVASVVLEASSAEDCVARAKGRSLVTVEPQIQDRPGGKVLVLPPDAGYGVVEEPLANVM